MFTTIMTGITTLVSGWFETKRAKQQADMDFQNKILEGEISYDVAAQRGMKDTIKDEYLILLHTFPVWGYMIPSDTLTSRLDILWLKLDTAPQWWFLCYMGMIISTFGLKFIGDKLLKAKR